MIKVFTPNGDIMAFDTDRFDYMNETNTVVIYKGEDIKGCFNANNIVGVWAEDESDTEQFESVENGIGIVEGE